MKKNAFTQIVATVGPSSSSTKILTSMIQGGVQSFRLNFSHGDYKEQLTKIKSIRKLCKKLCVKPTIILDTKGPEIRTHEFNDKTVIKANSTLRLFCWKEIMGGNKEFSVTYHDLCRDVKIGHRLLIDDGNLTLVCQKILDGVVICKAKNEHKMLSHRSVNIPDSDFRTDFISENDRHDLEFAAEHNLDWVALSFVGKAEDIKAARKILTKNGGSHIKICAKIESKSATLNLVEIVKEADAVMIARGDLAIEVDYFTVPWLQKQIIKTAVLYTKPVIVATQMLDHMTHNLMPTRAEIQDVYSASYAGADSCMLSGETANGDFPVQAVNVMSRLIIEANKDYFTEKKYNFNKLNNYLKKYSLTPVNANTKIIFISFDALPFDILQKIAKLHLPLSIVLLYKEKLHAKEHYYFGFTFNFFNAIVTDDLSPRSIKKLAERYLSLGEDMKYQFLTSKPVSNLKQKLS